MKAMPVRVMASPNNCLRCEFVEHEHNAAYPRGKGVWCCWNSPGGVIWRKAACSVDLRRRVQPPEWCPLKRTQA